MTKCEAGVEITAESQQIFREQLRQREGKEFIAKRAIERINNLLEAGQRNIVLDGLYSWSEYRLLKSEFHKMLEVVAIVAPRKVRHQRLANRPERPLQPTKP